MIKDLEEIILDCHQGPYKVSLQGFLPYKEGRRGENRRCYRTGSEEGRGHRSRDVVASRSWKRVPILPYSLQKEFSCINDFGSARVLLDFSISGAVR